MTDIAVRNWVILTTLLQFNITTKELKYIWLYYIKGKSMREIGEINKHSKQYSKEIIKRGIRKIRQHSNYKAIILEQLGF